MKIIKKKKPKTRKTKDREKESVFNILCQVLKSAEVEVRREQLKQGSGWRVLSGECDFNRERLIFVDSRMSQDDQIEFLASKIHDLKVIPSGEYKEKLPDSLWNQLQGTSQNVEN